MKCSEIAVGQLVDASITEYALTHAIRFTVPINMNTSSKPSFVLPRRGQLLQTFPLVFCRRSCVGRRVLQSVHLRLFCAVGWPCHRVLLIVYKEYAADISEAIAQV